VGTAHSSLDRDDDHCVDYRVAEGIAWVTLNRPDSLNAWTTDLGEQLRDLLSDAAVDDRVKCVVLTGAGRAFSSGADLRGPAKTGDQVLVRLREVYNPAILACRTMDKPVIAMVNGPAVGIGCSLALAADIVVAARTAYFLLPFVNIALSVDGGVSAWLAARVGHARALQMALDADKVDAETAERWGLINAVVPDEDLADEVSRRATRYAQGSTGAYARVKRLINERLYPGLAGHLDAEAVLQRDQADSEEYARARAAFAVRGANTSRGTLRRPNSGQ
jgi:2-(1,2-epoxy-1,2-dihydrophenyl)acetyl-CoA isomerase